MFTISNLNNCVSFSVCYSILKNDLSNNPEAGKNLELLLEKTKNLQQQQQQNNEIHEKQIVPETEGKFIDNFYVVSGVNCVSPALEYT